MRAAVKYLLKWIPVSILISLMSGFASAIFLFLLDHASKFHQSFPALIWGLPVCGLVIGWIYTKFGKGSERGNNLLIEEIHDPKQRVPKRMMPLILVSTLASHLFGASVGREGTAVQMSGALADQLTKPFKLHGEDRNILLMSSISAGFSSVFGTPWAGFIFGLEVIRFRKIQYPAILPCLACSLLADFVTRALGIHHSHFPPLSFPSFTLGVILKITAAGLLFGLAGRFFSLLTHSVSGLFKRLLSRDYLRPALGGLICALLIGLLGMGRYSGLGLSVIQEAFNTNLPPADFIFKLFFTALCVGAGLKGGEVTPIFFIGATMGSWLNTFFQFPTGFLTALGFVAVFAGAANTPLACIAMAMELFGVKVGGFALIVCWASFFLSGSSGIYCLKTPTHKR